MMPTPANKVPTLKPRFKLTQRPTTLAPEEAPKPKEMESGADGEELELEDMNEGEEEANLSPNSATTKKILALLRSKAPA